MSVLFYISTAYQNWFGAVVLNLGLPVFTKISLPQDFPSTQLSKEGLPLHTSTYLWYWIVVANVGGCYGKSDNTILESSEEDVHPSKESNKCRETEPKNLSELTEKSASQVPQFNCDQYILQ